MAITWLETDIVYSSSPKFKRCVGYEETGRNATSVTYKIYLKLKVEGSSSSFFGYAINWSVDGGSSMKIKDASPRWYGNEPYREFSTTITKSATASGGTTSFRVDIAGVNASKPNLSKSYTAKVSTWNTAPTWSSTAKITARANDSSGAIITSDRDGTENTIKIAENIGSIYLSWDSASDNEGNISTYELYNQVSESAWSLIYSGSDRNYTHNIGSGASTQGKSYDYYVIAVDSYGARSGDLNIRQFQKNQLTGANLSVSNGIWYNDTEMTLTWSGASNTNGNNSFTYSVSSSGVPIYNKEKLTASGCKIKILKSGTSTDPYILFSDVINYVSGSSTKTGSFTISLTTKNAYGSTVSKSATVNIDLRTDPQAPTSVTIGGHVKTNIGNYLIPARQNPTISWSGASDPLGGTLTYDVYYKVSGSSEVKVSAGTNTSIQIKIPEPDVEVFLSARVVATTSYGRSSTSESVGASCHYYREPSIALNNYNRTSTKVTFDIHSTLNTSIPEVALANQRYTWNGKTTNFTGATHTASITGLDDNTKFEVKALINDNTGLSSDVIGYLYVRPVVPMLSVRENGVGIKTINTGTRGASLVMEGTVDPSIDIDKLSGVPIDKTPYGLGVTTVGADNDLMERSTILHIKGNDNQLLQLAGHRNGTLYYRTGYLDYEDWTPILSETYLNNRLAGGTDVRGKIAHIKDDGVMEIGKYIDFHENGSTADYDARLQLSEGILWSSKPFESGNIRLQARDLLINGKRALVGFNNNDGNRLEVNFDNDYGGGVVINGTTHHTGFLYSTYQPPVYQAQIKLPTANDGNGAGDGETHLGYNGGNGYHHYFRGTGTTHIDTHGGLRVAHSINAGWHISTGGSVFCGDYVNDWRPFEVRRQLGGHNYHAKYGLDFHWFKLLSGDGFNNYPSNVIELYNQSGGWIDSKVLNSNVAFIPAIDDDKFLGTSSNRWKRVYAASGTVNSCSRDVKKDIVPVNNKIGRNKQTTEDIIIEGIKNLRMYSYKYRNIDSEDEKYIGFVGQDLEEYSPEFFNLIGSSWEREDEEGNKTMQYDIRSSSVEGVLMVGLQNALLEIDKLKEEIEELKKGGN